MFSRISNFSGPFSPFISGLKLLFNLDSKDYTFYKKSFGFDSIDSFGVTYSVNSVTSTVAGWNGNRATSVERISLGSPFKLKFKRGTQLGDIMCGVSQDPPINNDATYTRSSFGFYLGYGLGGDTGISITEGGNFSINVVTDGSFPASTIYSIVWDGIRVKYYINDTIFYSSNSVPTDDLFLYILFLQDDKTITDIEFGEITEVWNDTSPNHKNFTLVNAPKYLNESFYFNSDSGQYATGSDLGSLGKFTVDTWFNLKSLPTSNTNPQIITNTFDFNHPYVNFAIGFLNGNPTGNPWDGKICGGFFANSPIFWKYTGGFTPEINTWYNTTLTYDKQQLKFYLNGDLLSSLTCSISALGSGLGIDIGKRWDLPEFIDGKIDLARIWNGPLTESQISDNYNNIITRYIISTASLQFDGSSSLEIPAGSYFSLGNTYTIEFWSNAATDTIGGTIYTIMSQRDNDSSIDIFYQDGNLLIRNGQFVTAEPPAGVWTHVAIVSNAGTLSVYYNGIDQEVSGSGGNLIDSLYGLSIGCRGPINNFQFFNGLLFGIRINNTPVYVTNFDPYIVSINPSVIPGTILLIKEYQGQSEKFIDSSFNVQVVTNDVLASPDFPTPPIYGSLVLNNSVPFANGSYLSSTSSSIKVGTGDFSIECWVKPLAGSLWGYSGVLSYRQNSAGIGPGINLLNISGSGQSLYQFFAAPYPEYYQSNGSENFLENGRWYHLAMSRNNSLVTCFINGSVVSTFSSTWSYNISGVNVGRFYTNADTYYFNGLISNVRVNLEATYTQSFTPQTLLTSNVNTELLLRVPSNSPFKDSSINNYILTDPLTPVGFTSSSPDIGGIILDLGIGVFSKPRVGTWFDRSGLNNDSTLFNNPTENPSYSGLDFSSSLSQYVSTPITLGNTFSMSLIAQIFTQSSYPTSVWANEKNSGNFPGWRCFLSDDNTLSFGSPWGGFLTYTGTYSDLAMWDFVISGTEAHLYKNGQEVTLNGSIIELSSEQSENTLYFGARHLNDGTGSMEYSDVTFLKIKVWEYALTSNQVDSHYNIYKGLFSLP